MSSPDQNHARTGDRCPFLPSLEGPKTLAAWPVWSDSTTKPILFLPISKKVAARLWHRARDFDRQTRKPGQHGGRLGHAAMRVLEALIFDFLNYATGRLDPSHAAIARAANVCERTVRNALRKLKEAGIVNWVRRCAERCRGGRFSLEQETNAYVVLPEAQWRGYWAAAEPPRPAAGTWGDHPRMPSVLEQAAAEAHQGHAPADADAQQGMRRVIGILETDPADPLSAVLARLARSVLGSMPAKNP